MAIYYMWIMSYSENLNQIISKVSSVWRVSQSQDTLLYIKWNIDAVFKTTTKHNMKPVWTFFLHIITVNLMESWSRPCYILFMF